MKNRLNYHTSAHLQQVTLLQAQMSDFSYGKHAHEEYALGITLQGCQRFAANGHFYCSRAGTIMALNPGEVHDGFVDVETDLKYRMLYIHPEQLEPMLESAGVKHSRDFQISDTLLKDPLLQQAIAMLANSMNPSIYIPEADCRNKTSVANHASLTQEYWLYQLAARIAHRYQQFTPNQQARRIDPLLLAARDYILQQLTQELSLDQIGAHIGLSKYHFLRLFRQQFGITPHQYILNARINRVRAELERGAQLDDLVFDYGFSDLSHLNRRFKRVYGMTPKQYQTSVLQNPVLN